MEEKEIARVDGRHYNAVPTFPAVLRAAGVDVEKRDEGSGELHILGGTEGAGADSLDGRVSDRS